MISKKEGLMKKWKQTDGIEWTGGACSDHGSWTCHNELIYTCSFDFFPFVEKKFIKKWLSYKFYTPNRAQNKCSRLVILLHL